MLNIILGKGGNNFIGLGDGRDSVDGGPGNDNIQVSFGPDISTIQVNGRDTIDGGAGDDYIIAGRGGDRINGGSGLDRIIGGLGGDRINGGAGSDYISGDLNDAPIFPDTSGLYAQAVENYAAPLRFKLGGNDRIRGGSGRDTLLGERGNDRLNGDDDDDFLVGGRGKDTLNGGKNNDFLGGGRDPDTLNGGEGADRLIGDEGNDLLKGDAGPDRLSGGAQRDTLIGGAGYDELFGGPGNDRLESGTGQEDTSFIIGASGRILGSDELKGEAGDDYLVVGVPEVPPLREKVSVVKADGGTGDDVFEIYGRSGIPDRGTLLGDGDILLPIDISHRVTGGPGNDIFQFRAGFFNNRRDYSPNQKTIITDFELGIDKISLVGDDKNFDLRPKEDGWEIIYTFSESASVTIFTVIGIPVRGSIRVPIIEVQGDNLDSFRLGDPNIFE